MAEAAKQLQVVGGGNQLQNVIDALGKAASDPAVDTDKMKAILDMQERVLTRQAEMDFNAAMTAAQLEMGRVAADAENPQTKSMYASYAQLDRVLRPIYTRHGFALSFDEADSPKPEHIRVLCHVSHIAGHTRTYHRDMPVSTTGLAGKANMTLTHGNASAQSYGMRYLLKGIFNVAVGEDDNDGNAAIQVITDEQAEHLNVRINEVEDSEYRRRFLAHYDIAAIADLPTDKYEAALRSIEKKLKGDK